MQSRDGQNPRIFTIDCRATAPVADSPTAAPTIGLSSRPDGIKGHDIQYWSAPLRFTADGSILPLENLPSWQATVRIGEDRAPVSQPYILPKRKDPNPLKIHPCSNQPIPSEEWDTGEQP